MNTVFPVVISFTTIPSRVQRSQKALSRLLGVENIQNVILNVPQQTARHFARFNHRKLILNIVPEDLGPMTKIVPAVELLKRSDGTVKEVIIIACDDDCYHPDAFKIIAEAQDKNHSKSFTFWKYMYQGVDVPQGADLISFWAPNLADLPRYNRERSNRHCFFVDDLVIGNYLAEKGIAVEQLARKWKFPFIPGCLGPEPEEQLSTRKGEYSRDNSMTKCQAHINFLLPPGI